MLENVKVNAQSSIKFEFNKTLYFDPYLIKDEIHDADVIFITHEHYDHFDIESINNIKNDKTIIVVPTSMIDKASILFECNEILEVNPDQEYNIYDFKINTIRAYNNDKKFHPKEKNWVGYLVNIDNISYYIMGDTDDTIDARKVKCDVLFIPIGGTYTMNSDEGAIITNYLKPKVVVPIHYKTIVGSIDDANNFINKLDKDIEYKIYIK